MPGGAGAARAGEHAAEGVIAKAAKDFLRDASGPAGRDGIAATGRQAIPAGAGDAVRTVAAMQ